ncbi:hypothetical protein N4R57_05275 [Rhodobacteraceae bacterium D3-12]|nr:hypothetical protein N4R57_05275 [Rhodobacteraceae bacterium D3-12]
MAAVAVLAGFAALSGGFWVAKHETDTLHLFDIVLRRAAGEVPHIDYMTPLGVLAFEPFALLHRAGLELGAALVWGQVLVAAVLAPAAWWVAVRRMPMPVAIAFGLMIVLLAAGMVYGGTDTKLSLSMHYNRWAWALAFLALAVVALPAEREAPLADGCVVGLAMAALAVIKATYFVAFAPAVLVGLVLRGMGRTLGVAALAGLGVLGVLTLSFGGAIWSAYVGDLLAVMGSDVRAAPAGAAWAEVVLSPKYAGSTFLAVATVMMLRRRPEHRGVWLVLALMLPGALYATYQNFGNDPMWLLFWAVVMFSLPEAAVGWGRERVIGAVAVALILPVALNIAISPARQLVQPKAVFSRMFPDAEGRSDVFAVTARMETIEGRMALAKEGGKCQLAGGAVGWMRAQADALVEAQHGEAKVFVADLFNALWLFGDVERLRNGAPWVYGGLPGFDEAEVLVVPKCPIDKRLSARMNERIMMQLSGVKLTQDFENDLMVVYEISR